MRENASAAYEELGGGVLQFCTAAVKKANCWINTAEGRRDAEKPERRSVILSEAKDPGRWRYEPPGRGPSLRSG